MIKRILRIAIAMVLGVSLCALIATLLGADLAIQGTFEVSVFVHNVVRVSCYSVTTLLWVGFVFSGNWYLIKKPFIVYTASAIVLFFLLLPILGEYICGLVVSYFLPFGLLAFIGLKNKIVKRTVCNTLIWVGVMVPFMLITVYIKTAVAPDWLFVGEFIQGLYSSVEVIILAALLYLAGGESNVSVESFIYRGRGHDERIGEGSSDTHKFNFQDVLQGVAVVALIIVQFTIALIICKLGGVLIEGLIASVSFAIFGLFIRPRWHFRLSKKENESNGRHYLKNFLGCTFTSAGMFLVIGRTVPNFNYVLSASVLMGLAATMFFNRMEYVYDEIQELRAENIAFKTKPPFQCKTATADEIRARCLELGKSDVYADFLVAVHRSGRRQKEIADEFGIATETVKEYKRKRTREVDGV